MGEPHTDGHIKISAQRVQYFLNWKKINAKCQEEIGRGGYGVVFSGTLDHLPVVIKVSTSYPDASHTLKDEYELYKYIGQCSHLNTKRVVQPDDPTGIAYYYGFEDVHAKEDLQWDNRDMNHWDQKFPTRSHKCSFPQRSGKNPLCGEPKCKVCKENHLVLHVMILTRFGQSIRDVVRLVDRKHHRLDKSTVTKLMATSLVKIHALHKRGILHRDLKPNNMAVPLMPTPMNYANFYLIDLGLSKRWQDDDGNHIPYKKRNSYTGTIYYLGIHAQDCEQSSRRDDLQALAFIGLNLLAGSLPWDKYDDEYDHKRRYMNSSDSSVSRLKKERNSKIFKKKIEFVHHAKTAIRDVPNVFVDFLIYTNQLEFYEAPNYDYWLQRFLQTIDEKQWFHKPVAWYKHIDHTKPLLYTYEQKQPEEKPNHEPKTVQEPQEKPRDSSSSGSTTSSAAGAAITKLIPARAHKPKVEPVVNFDPTEFIQQWFGSLFSPPCLAGNG